MKCKEFRDQLQTGKEYNETLEKHISSCHECNEWVTSFIDSDAKLLKNADWDAPTMKCMPDISKYITEKKEITMFDSFKSGIKYGLVFGLAVVIALAFFKPDTSTITNSLSQKNITIPSAIPAFYTFESNFNKKSMFFVTDVDEEDSNISSFVEDEKIPSFYEEKSEESTWFETQSG